MTETVQHLAKLGRWESPEWMVDGCREVTGDFDLDPATTNFANKRIRAKKIYTARSNGLIRQWKGVTFLNSPGTCGLGVCGANKYCQCHLVLRFWKRLAWFHYTGQVPRAAWIGFQMGQLGSLQNRAPFHPLQYPTVFLKDRAKFELKGVPGDSPGHNNYITFMGCNVDQIGETFEPYGELVLPHHFHRTQRAA